MNNITEQEIEKIRPLDSYSPKYLQNRAGIYEWRKANPKKYKKYQKEYMARRYQTLTDEQRTSINDLARIRYAVRAYLASGVVRDKINERIKGVTGLKVSALVAYLGHEKCKIWVSGLRQIELDHIIPMSRFEKSGWGEGAFHYTNLRLISRSLNRNWHAALPGKVSPDKLESIVTSVVTKQLGLN